MRDFEDSTLWRISAFERVRLETGSSGFSRLDGSDSMLPSQFMYDIERLGLEIEQVDLLEVLAASLRHRQPALVCVQHAGHVWPLSVFPARMLVHSPRDLSRDTAEDLSDLRLLAIEPVGVRAPGDWMYDRTGQARHYRELLPLLWTLSLHGPRRELLGELGDSAAFRALRNPAPQGLMSHGAQGAALDRLRRESASMRDIAAWPGMSVERACRLLNALYLSASLMVTRHSPAARRGAPGLFGRLLGGRRPH